MTLVQPTLSLWDDPPSRHTDRIVADANDRVAWLKARARGVTATDVARLSGPKALNGLALEKLLGSRFGGNAFTAHGRLREPEIAHWARRVYGMQPSSALFHADGRPEHLATPDGMRERALSAAGSDNRTALELCEIKTTNSAWRSIPRHYLRQVWWQQYVLGAERTLVVWEQHDGFVPVGAEPEVRWVDRDENEIHRLIGLADQLLAAMRR
ncbi:YqaJ viral recombinase family protein [Lysinimonas soli]|uniref:YqaJ viral recombinase family protein n=1 Tax=Lysinimonas soli TaxID=1074233 RepID=A0ABW0NUN1_9MICO